MSEKGTQVKGKGAKKSAKRKLPEEVPERKSARLASIKAEVVALSSAATKKTNNAATKKLGKAASKKVKSKKEEDDASEMADHPEFDWQNAKSVHDFTVRDIKGEEVKLDKYKGNVLLIVNVASKCGLTKSNYEQLVKIDEQLRSKGLRILAFPCNQFGKQEPGSADNICEFVKKKNATFDLFEKIEVNGKNADPLYKYLKKEQPGTLGNLIKWNFTKFIVDKEGKPVERHAPTTSPESLIPNIEAHL